MHSLKYVPFLEDSTICILNTVPPITINEHSLSVSAKLRHLILSADARCESHLAYLTLPWIIWSVLLQKSRLVERLLEGDFGSFSKCYEYVHQNSAEPDSERASRQKRWMCACSLHLTSPSLVIDDAASTSLVPHWLLMMQPSPAE